MDQYREVFERPRTPEQISNALRRGELVDDQDFDAYLPQLLRFASQQFWTPIPVATLVAGWLAEADARRVLDVGSGCGKLCIIAALVSDLSFLGLEQRPHLVRVARKLASRFAIEHQVTFRHGTLNDVHFEEFDALYFYNSFAENVFTDDEHLDTTVSLSVERFHDDILRMEAILTRMPLGSRVVTYHGFGGLIPDSYDLTRSARTRTGTLRMWTKSRMENSNQYWLENEGITYFRHGHADDELWQVKAPNVVATRTPKELVRDDGGVLAEKVELLSDSDDAR